MGAAAGSLGRVASFDSGVQTIVLSAFEAQRAFARKAAGEGTLLGGQRNVVRRAGHSPGLDGHLGGHREEEPRFGRQFRVERVSLVEPVSA